jgi:WD40 repeat protein
VQLWDAASGMHRRTLDNHVGAVVDLAAGPVQNAGAPPLIVSVSEDRTVRLWQPTIGRLVRFARLTSVPRAVVWPTADRVLVGCSDGRLRVLDAETLEVVNDQPVLEGRICALATDLQNSRIVLAGENGRVTTVVFGR